MKVKQGRLAEAEADARAVLLSRLKTQGKYNPLTTKYVMGLAGILIEQRGRYADAEKLIRAALDIQRTIGIKDDTQFSAQIITQLGAVLTFQRKIPEAARVCRPRQGNRQLGAGPQAGSRAQWFAHLRLYFSGQVEAGIAAAQEALKRGGPRRRAALRCRRGARRVGRRLRAGEARCRCDPRVQRRRFRS